MRRELLIFVAAFASTVLGEESKPGYLGIEVEDSSPPQPAGASVKRVTFYSGAEAAGLLPGDVILSDDGTPVASAREFLAQRAKRKQLPGETCILRISRNAKESDVKVAVKKLGPERFLVQKEPPRTGGGTGISEVGGGTGEGSITNGGNVVLHVTAGVGVTTRAGDYEQLEAGLLSVNISGFPKHAIDHFTGDVKLAGMLHVTFREYVPKVGDAIELFADAKSLSGKFDLLFLPDAPLGMKWDVVYDDIANKVDLDGDGKLDVTLIAKPATD